MNGFTGINQFGSLTTQNGTRIDYKYFKQNQTIWVKTEAYKAKNKQ